MGRASKILLRLLAVGVPATLGAAAAVYSGALKEPAAVTQVKRPVPQVRVLTMAPVELLPRVSGFGTVEPAREWRAVARVSGEIAERAEGLAPGALFPAGTPLFRIDDSGLRLDLAEADAQIAASLAQDEAVTASLGFARDDLGLIASDLARQEQLSGQGAVSRAALDTARRSELSARSKVIELENSLKVSAATREVLNVQRASLERDIGFAQILAPYDLRITEVSADLGQYVTGGQVLVSAEGTEAVDVAAQFPIGRMGPLIAFAGGGTAFDLDARVRLTAPGHDVTWPARVVRVGEAIDATTQSAAIVVRVEDPLARSSAGERPPLRRNMLVEVVLSAPRKPALVAPAEALRGGQALVVSAEGTLEKRKVETGFGFGELAVVSAGLEPGDKLVVTDPTIAVPGMAVKPVEDEALKAALLAEASGSTPAAGSGGGTGKKKTESGE